MKTERRIKQNYNNSGKLAKRRDIRRSEAISRQHARLNDLQAVQIKFECPAIDAAVEQASKTLKSL